MTEQQIHDWEVERDIARTSGNQELIQKALDHKDQMLMRCIAHQSDRVKSIKADVESVKETITTMKSEVDGVKTALKPCVESDKDYRIQKERAKGAHTVLKIIQWLIAAGGGAFVMRLIQNIPN